MTFILKVKKSDKALNVSSVAINTKSQPLSETYQSFSGFGSNSAFLQGSGTNFSSQTIGVASHIPTDLFHQASGNGFASHIPKDLLRQASGTNFASGSNFTSYTIKTTAKTPTPDTTDTKSSFYQSSPIMMNGNNSGMLAPKEVAKRTIEESKIKGCTKIVGKYTNDYNLLIAHQTIISKLRDENILSVATLDNKLAIEKLKCNRPQTILERKICLAKIATFETEIKDITSGSRFNKYMTQIKPIIEAYSTIGPIINKIKFGEEVATVRIDDPNAGLRIELIDRFIEIACNYIEINLVRDVKENYKCKCGESLSGIFINDDGVQICSECNHHTYTPQYSNTEQINDTTKITGKNKDDYDSWENLYKALIRHQGRQINKITPALIKALDTYFANNKLPTIEDAKSLELDAKGRRIGTTFQMMLKALQDIKEPDYYEDARLLCKIIWGWTLRDLSHLEARIHADYILTQDVFNEMYKDRTSSIGTQYRLFKHLQLVGEDCNTGDFKLSIMREVIIEVEEIWKVMCDNAGDPRIYFIATI